MSLITDDWLAPEPLIVDRIRQQVTDLRAVYTAADLEALDVPTDTKTVATPAAHVFYVGDRLVEVSNDGQCNTVDQVWGVALVIRNSGGAAKTRAEAGRLIPKVVSAFAGWDCGITGCRPFRRAAVNTAARFYPSGKAIFPLFFSTRVIA